MNDRLRRLSALLFAVSMSHALAAPPASPAPPGVAFVHVNVVPMDREHVLRNQTVVVAGNRIVAKAVYDSRESVRSGNLLSEPLGRSPVFPPMVVRMIAIGERTGALEVLLEKIAEFYDAQVKAAVKSLTSLIEPILISVMGVIVGGVVMSVFLPILDVVGKLGGNG